MQKDTVRRNVRWVLLFATGCLLLVLMSGLTSAQILRPIPVFTGYVLTDLGVNTSWSFAYSINNAGQVVGDMTKWSGESRAFRTQPNQQINPWGTDDLGVLFNNYRSYAYAINNNGVVAGDSLRNYPYTQTRAIGYGINGHGLDDLYTFWGTPPTGLTDDSARGINDYGWIMGTYKTSNGLTHSMITFAPGWTQPVDSWYGNPAQSATYDVNNLDQMVGWLSRTAYNPPHAFFFDAAAGVMRLIDIGTLPGGYTSQAFALNESGQVVGQSDKWIGNQGWTHAFLFRDANNNGIVDAGEMKDLDTMGTSYSAAMNINNGGTAVGYYGDPNVVYGGSRAALYSTNGQMLDLNTTVQGGTGVWTLRVANGINDNGQIVGWMEDNNTDQQARVRHAFRLDPAPPRRLVTFP